MRQNISLKNNLAHDLILRSLKAMNSILMTIPFAAAWYLHYGLRITSPYYPRGIIWLSFRSGWCMFWQAGFTMLF